jgi:transcriptional regulator with XRE-family HTH domain
MTEARILSGISGRLRMARQRSGLSGAEVSRKLGLTRASVSQWETGLTEPKGANIRNLARIYGVSIEWLQTGRGPAQIGPELTQLNPMAEGSRIDLDDIGADLARPIQSAMNGRNAEVWKLSADKMAGAGYHSGDYLVVDLQQTAKPRDIVLAEIGGVPVFRTYLPPYLFAYNLTGAEPHLVVDQIRVILRGVVVSRFSFS